MLGDAVLLVHAPSIADPLPFVEASCGATAGFGAVTDRGETVPAAPAHWRTASDQPGRASCRSARLGCSCSRLRWPTHAVSQCAAEGESAKGYSVLTKRKPRLLRRAPGA